MRLAVALRLAHDAAAAWALWRRALEPDVGVQACTLRRLGAAAASMQCGWRRETVAGRRFQPESRNSKGESREFFRCSARFADTAGLDNPKYDFNDAALAHGVAYWIELAQRALLA